MKRTKTETLLGFSVRSGKIILGTDNILDSPRRKHLILYDPHLAANAIKKLESFAAATRVPILAATSSLSAMLNKPAVKAVAILDSNMAKEIIGDIQKASNPTLPTTTH